MSQDPIRRAKLSQLEGLCDVYAPDWACVAMSVTGIAGPLSRLPKSDALALDAQFSHTAAWEICGIRGIQ